MSGEQLDMFAEERTGSDTPTFPAEKMIDEWRPKQGTPHFMAAQELINFVKYYRLNEWQRSVLWPHLRKIVDYRLEGITDTHQLDFELGYIIGAIEIEQIRTRSDCLAIARKHGVRIK